MNKGTKIALSAKEQELINNTDWILTKHAIIQKVYAMFGNIAASMQQTISQNATSLPQAAIDSTPKISKGENYLSLPYVMLDYPRCFKKEDTLAVRTLFWWGNFFSINLQLSGASKDAAAPKLSRAFLLLRENGYSISLSDDPWQHHFSKENYTLINDMSEEKFSDTLHHKPFIKIGKTIPLQQWDDAPLLIERAFAEIIMLLKD